MINIQGHLLGNAGNGSWSNPGQIAIDGDIHNYPKPEFPIHHLPLPNRNFAGREAELAQLHTTLSQREATVAITQTISGLGGVGKTQLALAYAQKYRTEYELVWWLNGSSSLTLTNDLMALGQRVHLPLPSNDAHAARQMVLSWVSSVPRHWLLIYDNVDGGQETGKASDSLTPKTLRPYLPSGGGAIVITSRNQQWDNLAVVLPLQVFSPAESATFWRERLGKAESEEELARAELAEELGRLPLVLEHAAAYMREKGKSASGYLQLYRTQRQRLWAHTPPPNDYHATVATTWQVSFEQVQKTEGAAELLTLCSFLASDNIPSSLLIQHADALLVNQKGCLQIFFIGLRSIFRRISLYQVVKDEVAWNEAVATLQRYSFIRVGEEGEWEIHRLVQAVIRDGVGKRDARGWIQVNVAWLSKAYDFDPYDIDTWPAAGRLLPHMQVAVAEAERWGMENEVVAWLNISIGFYFNQYGQLQEAKPYYACAHAICEKVLGAEHPATAQSLNNRGYLLQAMGELAEARPYYARALAIWEKVLGAEHPDTAISLNNMGALLREMGELAEARPYYARALAIHEKVSGAEHPDTATSLNNMGALLQEMGELAEARPYVARTLAICEKVLGGKHPATAASLNNMGRLLYTMGELAEARPYYTRALAIRQKVLGVEHPDTANSLYNLAWLCDHEEDYLEAARLMRRAVVILEKTIPNHLNTQSARESLAAIEAKLAQS